ncbi:hypothetical protein BKA65DRAFT_506440 [Rhexocercosporidium sp. MPI-PUGE-AT-0058]|nr:hypothetical protein BKA65DRAFT_506440 [Rhexocercosporidium sp. MPI-PUGE-AT-0058]
MHFSAYISVFAIQILILYSINKYRNRLSSQLTMAPSEFTLRLQVGITGGFAPPSPSAIHTITRDPSSPQLTINSLHRTPGSPDHQLTPQPTKNLPVKDYNTQIEQIYSILKELPTEEPVGSEDIYGLDTGVSWSSGDGWKWSNGGPEGCGSEMSDVQVGKEEKVKFGEVVRLVIEIAEGSE